MDHIVFLDARSKEIDNLLKGNKTMIIRAAQGQKMPHGRVSQGDILYFVNNNNDCMIRAKGTVSSVFCSDVLTVEESFETIIRNQDKLQLPDRLFDKMAGKRYLVLVGLENILPVNPVRFRKRGFENMEDWLPVGRIEEFIFQEAE